MVKEALFYPTVGLIVTEFCKGHRFGISIIERGAEALRGYVTHQCAEPYVVDPIW